jgi:hypothetical protein
MRRPIVRQVVPDKLISTYAIGPYRIDLRQMSYDFKSGVKRYELAIWKNWRLISKTNWAGWDNGLREFEFAKRKVAVNLAETVLFNQVKPEDQDDE